MPSKRVVDGKVQVTIRIDEELERLLREHADRRIVSFAWLCNRLLAEGLKLLEPDPLASPPDP